MISTFKKKVLSIFYLHEDICQPFSQQEIQKWLICPQLNCQTNMFLFLREIGRATLSEDYYDVIIEMLIASASQWILYKPKTPLLHKPMNEQAEEQYHPSACLYLNSRSNRSIQFLPRYCGHDSWR